ncbi:HPr family phosphocarrier protein [Calditrichota bacterium]
MITGEIRITNKLGLHARPATKLVKIASQSGTEVIIEKEGVKVNASSILGVMLLQAEYGSIVKVSVTGENEQIVLEEILNLIRNKFDEE